MKNVLADAQVCIRIMYITLLLRAALLPIDITTVLFGIGWPYNTRDISTKVCQVSG